MTFDEWKAINAEEIEEVCDKTFALAELFNNSPDSKENRERFLKVYDNVEKICEMAWQAAQPKWTYCKDGLPTEDGNYLVAVLLTHGRRIVLSSDYDANNGDFWEIDPDKEVIAWQPLPEVPSC